MVDLKIGIPLVLQAIGTLIAMFGIPTGYLQTSFASRGRLRDEYKFAKEYLTDLQGEESLPRYLREKGCQAITGQRDANPEHIEYLLSMLKPGEALRLYASGKQYLETEYVNGNRYLENPNRVDAVSLVFKRQYQKRWKRAFIQSFFFLLYCVPASSLMWAPRLIRYMAHDVAGQLIVAGLWFVTAILLGWFFISRAKRITWAGLLIKLIADDREIKEHIRLREKAE